MLQAMQAGNFGSLKEGRELKLFVGEFRTPISGETAVEEILLAFRKVNGLIHMGGKASISS